MRVTFDPAKDAANLEKHGISLLDAMGFEWDTALVWSDTRQDYGEPRMVALGYIGLRIMCLCSWTAHQRNRPSAASSV